MPVVESTIGDFLQGVENSHGYRPCCQRYLQVKARYKLGDSVPDRPAARRITRDESAA